MPPAGPGLDDQLARLVVVSYVEPGGVRDQLPDGGGVRVGGEADEHPVAAEPRLELRRRALGDHPPDVHHGDPVGQLVRLVEVLGREQHRRAQRHHAADGLPHVRPAARVEPGGGLVEEQDGRPGDEPGRDVEAAPHPAGVGGDLAPGGVVEVEGGQQLGRPRPRRRGRQAVQPAEHHEVLAAEEDLVEGRGLSDQPDGRADLAGPGADVEAGDRGLALLDAGQGGQGVDGGALAGAVGPEEGVHGSGGDGEVEAVEGGGAAVVLAQPARGQRGGGGVHGAPKFVRCTEITGHRSIYSVRRTEKLGWVGDRTRPRAPAALAPRLPERRRRPPRGAGRGRS